MTRRDREAAERRRREYLARIGMGEPPQRAARALHRPPPARTGRPLLKLIAGGATAARRPATYVFGRRQEDQ